MDSAADTAARAAARITSAVVASFDECPDDRLRLLMQRLVHHLHAFTVEVGLTESEWAGLIATLTATGHLTDERRQEFILWSDTLGLSMLVDALAHPLPGDVTESTILGPFYVPDSPLREYGADLRETDSTGTPALVHGRVLSSDGVALGGAEVDVWQNDVDHLYTMQKPEAPEDHLRGRFRTRPDGSFSFLAVRPTPYPIPDDGPVGQMLQRVGRHPWRPAHIHMIVRAAGHPTLTTHIFDADSRYLHSDTVFAVKQSLIRGFVEHAAGDPSTPDGVRGPWVSLECDIVLAPADDERNT